MNNIATIETIHSFKPHPNADALELAMVRGFQVVVKKDQFSHGQKVIFVWPDTISEPAEWNSFLDKDKKGKPIKVKSCKLRGQFSTGLVLPISTLFFPSDNNTYAIENGHDVSLLLGVKKYIKDDGQLNTKNGESAGDFPSGYISKTDEMLAQSEPDVHSEFLGESVYVTLKIDGQSLTFIRDGEGVCVCSRNLKIKDGDNKFWNTVRKYGLIEKTEGMNIAIQGEQYGPSIQKNPLAVKDISFAVFTIKNLDTGKHFNMHELLHFCADKNIPMVPVIEQLKYPDSENAFERFQNIADNLKYDSNHPAEGIVVRPIIPKHSLCLGRMLSVKFINRNYKD
jgi:RNA ligase (TIGR02306 family)